MQLRSGTERKKTDWMRPVWADGKVIRETFAMVEDGRLVLTADSRIPCAMEGFYYSSRRDAMEGQKRTDMNFGPVNTMDGKYVILDAIEHPELVTRFQLAVTYRTRAAWSGETPSSGVDRLPRFRGKLERKEPVRIVLYGDCISCGFDCSGMCGQEPEQPVWPELVKDNLEQYYGVKVELINTSVGGEASDWALEHVQERG